MSSLALSAAQFIVGSLEDFSSSYCS